MKNDDEKLRKLLKKKCPSSPLYKEFFLSIKKETCFVLPYEIFFSLYIFFFSFNQNKRCSFLRDLSFCFCFFYIRSGVSLSFHLVRCFVCVCVYNFTVSFSPFLFFFCYYYYFCFVLVTILVGMKSDEQYVLMTKSTREM